MSADAESSPAEAPAPASQARGAPLLSIEGLHVGYGAISALQGVSLEVHAGEVVALIGSNGAGKTTLLRTISGLIRPRAGEILWRNKTPITKLPPHEIVALGICHSPEGRQVFANLTVRENLLLGGYSRGNTRSRRAAHEPPSAGLAAAEPSHGSPGPTTGGEFAEDRDPDIEHCFQLFPVLGQRRGQKAGTLSGGEQQMLAIGRALMARPQVLLLDEPSLGLAPLVVRKIFQIIREINARGTTVFLVEQNAHMALTVAHRGYVLQAGRVILTDAASRLLEHPDVRKAYLGG